MNMTALRKPLLTKRSDAGCSLWFADDGVTRLWGVTADDAYWAWSNAVAMRMSLIGRKAFALVQRDRRAS